MPVQDIRGRTFQVPPFPRRIVSLVPSLTETLFAWGAGDRVVGITDYCIHPRDGVAIKPRVGGTKNPRVRDILALSPDLVIVNVEENRKADIEALEANGVPVFVTFPRTVREAVAELRVLGALAGTPNAEATIAPVEAWLSHLPSPAVRPRVFIPIWRDPWMTANGETYIGDLIETCGGTNIFRERRRQFRRPEPERDTRYPHVTLAEVAAASPDVVLLPDEPYRFGEQDAAELRGITNARIHLVDGTLVSWYGIRMARALETITRLESPDG